MGLGVGSDRRRRREAVVVEATQLPVQIHQRRHSERERRGNAATPRHSYHSKQETRQRSCQSSPPMPNNHAGKTC
ncbi:hypothetical protein LC608_33770 [Nostoc sp. XA010]|uniref:hypothetical protein n=1 Tax=Nostoc sp. XA010 TaxID=2780407 RepID=UPI001E4E6CCA|nr:hypothetical protein [Nostoc sp. XA010]MCC5661829.1 hypothetical protein [Nostoc sp. XA010]